MPRDAWPRRCGSGALLIILAFLVLYPVAMLLLGALTNTNPVVDGFGVFDLSLENFVAVLGNANVHLAFANSLIACGGGTVARGRDRALPSPGSWCAPTRRARAYRRRQPDAAVRAAAGRGRGLVASSARRKPACSTPCCKWIGIDWRFNFYSMAGLIVVFGIYYAPYVYMFTASALRNMDPASRRRRRSPARRPFATLFTVTFPLIAPAIISGMLLSFVVMLGIYGIPAVLGAPANIQVLTTYIFKLTAWSRRSTARPPRSRSS